MKSEVLVIQKPSTKLIDFVKGLAEAKEQRKKLLLKKTSGFTYIIK
ncbi:hypothetical protein M8998_00725 [Sphingobacterium sp. lm-10]|nr:hypothetical protein [Sphingobacterium sp. lm-10]MCL7986453.1 hypothetical protein [Sphingobacterium sp. lm-10]